jgi:hypothetical protein
MRSSQSRGDDDLGVLISLAIAVGMLIGAMAVILLWSTMSESTKAVMSLYTDGLIYQSSGHDVMP